MDKQYNIDGHILKVNYKPHTVHFTANMALRSAMRKSFRNIEALAARALKDYELLYNERLNIGLNSLVVEILGHVYAYQVLLAIRKRLPLSILRKLSDRACGIDCGDRRSDSNRWFWDLLGYAKPLLFLFERKQANA